jgi:hypothetical protein
VAWFGKDGEPLEWTGALLPFPVASRSPEAIRITDHGDLGADEKATANYTRERLHYQQHPPDNGEDTSNMTPPADNTD